MTEIVITGKECNCDPNHDEEWTRKHQLIEGLTVVRICPHTESFIKRRYSKWEVQGR